MRAGRTVAAVLGVVLAVLVAGVWLVPSLLDWSRYRGSVAGLVAAAIGRPVRIGGDVTLHLLPQPILTAAGIEVDDWRGTPILSAQELRLRVALGPLLGGRVDARELTLRGADLHLPWPPPAGALAQRPPEWLTGLQARVEDSRLEVGDVVLSGLDASLGTDPDTGTLSTAGTATMFGRSWQFTARLARPGRDGAASLDMSLDGQGKLRDTGGTFSGVLAADGSLAGRVAGRGPDLSELMPGPQVAWRGDGRLSAASGLAVADELALEIGGSPATGAVALRVQPQARLDVALAAGRLDLDAWIPVLIQSSKPGAQPALPTGIDLSAEAATLAGGTLRRLRGAFDLEADGVIVRDASALLPGDATLNLSGRLPGRSPNTLFEGNGRIDAPDLRATLHWLEKLSPAVVGALPPGTLRTASLSASVTLDPQLAALSDLRGTLDGSALQGGLSLRIGPRAGVSAGLSLDQLEFDPWLPEPAGLADPAADYTRLTQALGRAGFDADIKLQVRKASWRGADLGMLSVDAQSEAGRLTLRRLEASPFGAHLTASGTLGDGGRISEARLDASAQDLAPLQPMLPQVPLALLRGPGSLLLQLSGLPDALAVRGTMDVGDLRIEAQPVVNLGARRWAGPVTMQHPGAPRLLEILGVPGTASWLGDGSFSLIAQLVAEPGGIAVNDFALIAGALRAAGRLGASGGAISGRVAAETLPLPLISPSSPASFSFEGLGGTQANVHLDVKQVLLGLTPVLQDLATDLSEGGGAIRLDHVGAKVAGGTVSGSAALTMGDLPRLTVQGSGSGIDLAGPLWGGTLDVLSGHLDGKLDIVGEGHSPVALLATLAGTADLQVRDGVATGFDLAAAGTALAATNPSGIADAVRAALTGGTTPFASLAMPITAKSGVVSLGGELAAPAGAATLTGSLDLSSGALEGRLTLHPGEQAPEVAVRLTGSAVQPVRTPELAGLARWLAERS